MKLKIINQSSNIELTSYQIAFMENVLHLARVKEELRDFWGPRNCDIENVVKKEFTLNIPIYLVNKYHFKELKKSFNQHYFNDNIPEPEYPDEKHYISEEDLHRRELMEYDEIADENISKLSNEQDLKKDIENEFDIKNEDKYKGKMDKTVTTEVMGLYCPNYSVLNNSKMKQPAIFLCMQTISEKANNHNEFLYLTTLVLLHEISHYIMDSGKEYTPQDEFSNWMEESLANCLTLNLINNILVFYTNDYPYNYSHRFGEEDLRDIGKHNINQFVELFDYCKEFIISQPKNYQLGYYLFIYENNQGLFGTWRWTSHKHKLSNFLNKEKQDWLDYVKYDVIEDNGAKLKILYDTLFDGLYKISIKEIEKENEQEKLNNYQYNWANGYLIYYYL